MLVENSINKVNDEELERDSIEVFKENVDEIKKIVTEIQEWIRNTAHMVNTRSDDLFIKLFLRGCNYDQKQTKEKLDMYFTVRYVYSIVHRVMVTLC